MIRFLDLQAQYRGIRDEVDSVVAGVLASGQYVLGHEVAAFEEEFAAYCHTKHAIALNSGTSALHLALLAAGIGAGDEVITVPFTFVATVAAVCYTSARPVFVDIEPATLTMDASQLEGAITERTRAILPVHLYGQPADMDSIMALARRYKLVCIEDAAQAHGAQYKGRRVGSIGDMGCFSFYPGKNLGACGEGGIVVTDNPEYARTIRMLRDWGQEQKYFHVLKGFNYRMEALQGAILRVKLRHLEDWTESRRNRAAMYDRLLACSGVRTLVPTKDVRHVYHVYPVLAKRREELQQGLLARGVQTGIHYPTPVHLLEAYLDLGYKPRAFPCSEQAAAEELSLPMYPELSEQDVESVAAAVRDLTAEEYSH